VALTRNQLNVRVTPEIEAIIDAKRIELAKSQGTIPTRSDVVRFALEAYLGTRFDEQEVAKPQKSTATSNKPRKRAK
jgi:Arc/MetJ-type ribon-helix-helix transcriptional regulator